jgi:hypothetical protein
MNATLESNERNPEHRELCPACAWQPARRVEHNIFVAWKAGGPMLSW